jgi:type III restriction enzyme
MATGTGKTLLMASLILYLYQKGYRKFLFFVNSNNILEKTKQNFTNSKSNKFLFEDNLQIDGKNVLVRSITNFDEADNDNINILFTTIQGLHSTLNTEKENSTTFADFKKHKIVLLADEAHHNSSQTKKQIDLIASWERTILTSFLQNNDNYLIELSATANLDDDAIADKYKDKVIFNYDLKEFRKDGYSKDIRVVDTEISTEQRILLALITSEYKRFIASENRLQIKPVILFKSLQIKHSEENSQLLQKIVEGLTLNDLNNLSQNLVGNNFLLTIKDFISNNQDFLLNNIPKSFHFKRVINVNNEKANEKNQLLLNSLENKDNQIRVIFAVNKLNEGWDVLNLYDIVKLYQVKNAKKTATSEVQLIGRGARYCPFLAGDDKDEDYRYKRKYDKNINNKLHILEQLHYHSLQEVAFINELNKQLELSGLAEPTQEEIKISLKDDFINSDIYKNGLVFSNTKFEVEPKYDNIKEQTQQNIFKDRVYQIPIIQIEKDLTSEINEHAIDEELVLKNANNKTIKLKNIADNVFYKAISCDVFFNYNNISKYIKTPIKSVLELKNIFKDSGINFKYNDKNSITSQQLLTALFEVLQEIKLKMDVSNKLYQGSLEFRVENINRVFKNIKRLIPKDIANSKVIENTNHINYFAQDSFYGDSSYEKNIINELDKFFSEDSNKNIYQDKYMLRNHNEIKLYNFENGKGFEPDFLLFLKKSGVNISYQIFIEVKGEHLALNDAWKEEFLSSLCQIENPDMINFTASDKYKIVGMPFYSDNKNNEFLIKFAEKFK